MAAVFLDLDGTLVDPKPGITGAVIHALTQLGLTAPAPDDLEWVIGPPLQQSFARLGVPDVDEALALYRERYSETGLFEARVYDGVADALEELQGAGHRLLLMTAKPHVFAKRITAHFRLDQYLQAQFGPELDGTRQNKADLLGYALAKTGIDKALAVMVGDRDHDRNAALANDVAFVAALWGYGSGAELDGADRSCARPSDLPSTIAGLTG